MGKHTQSIRTKGTLLLDVGKNQKAIVVVGDMKIRENTNKVPDDLADLKTMKTGTASTETSVINANFKNIKNSFFLGESSHAMGYSYDKLNQIFENPYHVQMIDHSLESAWLDFVKDGNGKPNVSYIEFEAPNIVIIGDSIIEGHPDRHSRIHDSKGNVDLELENSPGQLSYHLTDIFGCNVVNQGWGGSRTDHTWDRWRRDVLAEVYDPKDTKGEKTLNKKPHAVIIGIGINDIAMEVPIEDIKERMLFMAESCIENEIYCTFLTIPPDTAMNSAKIATCFALNEWIRTELSEKAEVIDLYMFATNGNQGWGQRNDFQGYADGVHFSQQGYAAAAQFIASNTKHPLFLKELHFESLISPLLSHTTRVQDFKFESGSYNIESSFENVPVQIIKNPICRSKKQKLSITTVQNFSKTYQGITAIKGVFERRG